MSKMTFQKRFVFAVAMCLALTATVVRGGSLDAPAAPSDPASAMYTLNDIYNVLSNGAPVPKRTGAFVEPSGEPTNGTMRTLNDIMALAINRPTGSTSAPVPKTGQVTSYAAGDDGSQQKGVAWPNPRFTNNGNGTVTDNLTGLMWMSQSWERNWFTWDQAMGKINAINSGAGTYGHTDWRMPNINELWSMYDFSLNGVVAGPWDLWGVAGRPTWSSSAHSTGKKWAAWFGGGANNGFVTSTIGLLWPVRGGN